MLGARRGKRVGEGGLAVGPDAEIGHDAAETFEQRLEHEAVGVIDRAGRQRRAGLADLVAGRQQRHRNRRNTGNS